MNKNEDMLNAAENERKEKERPEEEQCVDDDHEACPTLLTRTGDIWIARDV